MDPLILFTIIILVFSVILHEVSHGYVAEMLGDPTARLAGRLTLNPIPHIDLFGSVLLPALLVLTSSPILFGYAKPVPYNPYNLRNQRWGEAMVAAAGPLTNLAIAILFGLSIRFLGPLLELSASSIQLFMMVTYINILLALFNLIPIPPLDGSKVLSSVLPYSLQHQYRQVEYLFGGTGFFGLLLFIFIFFTIFAKPFSVFVGTVFTLITGLSL